ncbi:MAG: DNA/RNA non-specific endonuclease [Clostridia bacterium]|nr:DNA/RNA non-specific endonuclease [Clostridia bacterium]
MKKLLCLSLALILLCSLLSACTVEIDYGDIVSAVTTQGTSAPASTAAPATSDTNSTHTHSGDIREDLPQFSGEPFVALNGNVPDFHDEQLITTSYEYYSELDHLGRCGYTEACVGLDIMPTEDRGNISHVKPTGWQSVQYDHVDGKSLYNRCHLIGFQLTGENANEQNLITGTRYMNVDGMLPFENQIASYTETTGNHVLYRVSPVYSGKNLVCAGLQLEALSVEDGGEGICFNVFVYNVQPGIVIDYASGASRRASDDEAPSIKPSSGTNPVAATYIINISTKKFHYSTCSSVKDMSEKNKLPSEESRNVIVKQGFVACKRCNP